MPSTVERGLPLPPRPPRALAVHQSAALPLVPQSTPETQTKDFELWVSTKMHGLAELALGRWLAMQPQGSAEATPAMVETMLDCLHATEVEAGLRRAIAAHLLPADLHCLCRLPEPVLAVRKRWAELFSEAWADGAKATDYHSREQLFIRYSRLCMPMHSYDYRSNRATLSAVYAGLNTGYAGLLRLADYYDTDAARAASIRAHNLDALLPRLLDSVFERVGPAFYRLMEVRPVGPQVDSCMPS